MGEVVGIVATIAEVALNILAWVGLSQRWRPRGEEAKEDSLACLACGKEIPEEQSRCPACEWSYDGEGPAGSVPCQAPKNPCRVGNH
jgi:hypothetical protein